MNRWFVNVKVDREERPDVDRVYMLATELMTGGGGWPNNVFLTPDLKPFYAGSYFPPRDEGGRPGFPTVLATIHKAWVGDRSKLQDVAARVYQGLQQAERQGGATGAAQLDAEGWLGRAEKQAAGEFDSLQGGFSGGRDEVPSSAAALDAAGRLSTAPGRSRAAVGHRDARGDGRGRRDGSARRRVSPLQHSTEPGWSIPHFEKMLYDNAQLLGLYARAYAITKRPFSRQVALRTAHYLTREVRAPGGGFYGAQDSQIDGVEGVSYLWTRAQIEAVLGEAGAKRFFGLYALTQMLAAYAGQMQSPGGVLRLDDERARALAEKDRPAAAIDALAPQRKKLLAARNRRPPARDEKVVIAGNALAILGFLEAGQALRESSLTRTAVDTANWAWAQAFDARSGGLRHQSYRGRAGGDGFLDDYALLGRAFLALHAATGDALWRSRAQRLTEAMLERFARPDGSLATTTDTADLIVAPPSKGDSVRPSGQSAAVALLLGLAADGGDARRTHRLLRGSLGFGLTKASGCPSS